MPSNLLKVEVKYLIGWGYNKAVHRQKLRVRFHAEVIIG